MDVDDVAPGAVLDDGRSVRQVLRALRVFDAELPGFDPGAAPDEPVALFLDWLQRAVAGGVREPHAMTLCTVDGSGRPSGRVLICKDVTVDGGWLFASSASSRKGRELAAHPEAALGFHWPEQGRQVQVRGTATSCGPRRSAEDFLARPEASRIEGLVARQSQVLEDPADLPVALEAAQDRILADPGAVAPAWTLYALAAREVEFWQADRERRHVRLQYLRAGDRWTRRRLWP